MSCLRDASGADTAANAAYRCAYVKLASPTESKTYNGNESCFHVGLREQEHRPGMIRD